MDTCSLAGLFPGVRRSSVSFVFSFKILILAMQPGCVELLSHPSSHMQELKKKKKKSSSVLKMTALLSSKNFSLNYSRFTPCHWISLERRRLKGNQYWKTLEMLCSSPEVSERLQLGNAAYFFKYTTEFLKIQSLEEQTFQHFLKIKLSKTKTKTFLLYKMAGNRWSREEVFRDSEISDFPVATEGFHFFLPARFWGEWNWFVLTLSVSVRERS